MRKKKVHAIAAFRSDGNDTACNSTGDVEDLAVSDKMEDVTCRRCQRVRFPEGVVTQ